MNEHRRHRSGVNTVFFKAFDYYFTRVELVFAVYLILSQIPCAGYFAVCKIGVSSAVGLYVLCRL